VDGSACYVSQVLMSAAIVRSYIDFFNATEGDGVWEEATSVVLEEL